MSTSEPKYLLEIYLKLKDWPFEHDLALDNIKVKVYRLRDIARIISEIETAALRGEVFEL